MMARMQTVQLSVNCLRSPVAMAGDPTLRSAVVFVHGVPGSGSDWAALMQQVAPFSRALAPDMPGFGRADKPEGFDYSVDGYARHLAALLDLLGVARAHLVLHDFGGAWGLAWAAAHVDRVASITLLNTGLTIGYRWHPVARVWCLPVIGELSMLAASRIGTRLAMRLGNPRGMPRAFVDGLYDNFDRGTRRAVLKLYRSTSDPGVLSARIGTALGPHRLPALVVWGECDPYIPATYADAQHQYVDVRRVVRLAQSGHWPMIDDPAATAAAVVPFLREHSRDDSAD